ncbi:UvrD-helicase domain-containing protein [Comamonas sp. SCN 65-56]
MLVVTFTDKAARELTTRISNRLSFLTSVDWQNARPPTL